MLPTIYFAAGGVILALAAGFYGGTQHEHRTHIAREAETSARIEEARKKLQAAFDAVSTRQVEAAQIQTQTFTEIRRVAGPIVYRNVRVCLDAGDDGVGLLDKAAAAASGGHTGEPDGDAAPTTQVSQKP